VKLPLDGAFQRICRTLKKIGYLLQGAVTETHRIELLPVDFNAWPPGTGFVFAAWFCRWRLRWLRRER